MVTLANELQLAKTPCPTSVTEMGMVTLANELQPLKAKCPIPITELGMLTLANELQPWGREWSRLPMSCSL